jgi:hypothetical protein
MYPGKMFIAWLKMMMVVLVHMKTIHMKTSDDGTMLIKRLVKGACELLQNTSGSSSIK